MSAKQLMGLISVLAVSLAAGGAAQAQPARPGPADPDGVHASLEATGHHRHAGWGERHVGPGQDYGTIQAAIDAADPGDTIIVHAGTYAENPDVDEELTIRAAYGDLVIVDGGFTLDANNITLKGLTIKGGNVAQTVYAGVYPVAGKNNLAVVSCVLDGAGKTGQYRGIEAGYNVTNLEVIGCIIRNWPNSGIYLNPTDGPTLIHRNTFENNLVGIGTDGQNDLTIQLNRFVDNTGGEDFGASNVGSNVVARFNAFDGDYHGINHYGGNQITAEKNWWGTSDGAQIAGLISGDVDYTPWLLTSQIELAFGGNRLVDMQNNDGGWDWPLNDGNPDAGSAVNTVGPIAMGLSKAYRATGDPDLRTALGNAGTFLLAKTNNYSPCDGYLAAELDSVFGGTTYYDELWDEFYGPLHDGTYDRNGAGTPYNTAGYVQLVRDAREGQGIPNLAAWDLGMGLVAAASCGVSGDDLQAWIDGVKAEINELEAGTEADPEYYDVIGLAGALYGLAFVGEEFDPTAGEHAAASSLRDLADILASYQIPESGGFTWNANYMNPYEANETTQETAYSILALDAVGGYDTQIEAARDWLLWKQLPTGGWDNYEGASSENNEVTGEALWGIWTQSHGELTLEPDRDCYTTDDTVTVELWMRDIDQPIVGGQFFLAYDTGKLAFVRATPESPFAQLYLDTSTPGEIDYAVQIPPDGSTTGTQLIATLEFTAQAELCSETDLITWRAHDPPTRLSDENGDPVYPLPVAMDVIDTVAPTATQGTIDSCYPDASSAEAAALAATTDLDDNCDPNPTKSVQTGAGDCDTSIVIRVEDHCGNYTDYTYYTRVDGTPPVVTPPASAVVECDGSGNTAELDTWLASATADDNCDGALTPTPVLVSYVQGCCETGVYTYKWQATDTCGNVGESETRTFTIQDTTPPEISGCPQDITVYADAGQCSAVVSWTEPTASDVCCGSVPYSHRSHAPGYSFPVGTTTVTYEFTDDCGNMAECRFDVTVEAYSELVVDLELEGMGGSGTLTRCITFELWDCDPLTGPTVVEEVITFTNGSATGVTVLVPCGEYTCITARDELHTLRRTDETFGIVGTQYVASFTGDPGSGGDWLIGGNLNDDYWIDILDFGVFSSEWGVTYPGGGNTDCTTSPPHADVSGDGTVWIEDFTFIQNNFLEGHEANCCGQPGFGEQPGPITRISVEDLRAMGLGELAAGDLNQDGWLDEADIAAFMNGARPQPQPTRIEDVKKVRGWQLPARPEPRP